MVPRLRPPYLWVDPLTDTIIHIIHELFTKNRGNLVRIYS
jgi:hypothetical protein